jgi:large subunit ribosomal protein L31
MTFATGVSFPQAVKKAEMAVKNAIKILFILLKIPNSLAKMAFFSKFWLSKSTTSIGSLKMKEGIHPNYQPVVFVDANTGKEYITRSTKSSAEKKTIDGVEHSVISLEITADTHPFWTGKQHRVDTAGRIDRFNKRFAGNITGAKRKTRKAAPAKAEEEA